MMPPEAEVRVDLMRPLWRPSAERVSDSHLVRFAEQASQRGYSGHIDAAASPMPALHAWSISDPEAFWAAVWDFSDIRSSRAATEVVDDPTRMPGAEWFSGARLNFAENLLADRYVGARRPEAIIGWNEDGRFDSLTWEELSDRVASFADGLRRAGVTTGDRVAGFLPNIPEAVIAMLATSSLGAVWSSCSPDFGIDGVLDRFGQIEPKVLVATRGARWNGSWRDSLPRVREIAERLPSLEVVVLADYGARSGPPDSADVPKSTTWDDFAPAGAPTAAFAQLPFDHPLYVLYSSGTTGMPKCIVHGQGGSLIQHTKELLLHCDLRPGDRICYYTTCGWMMWNWMVTSLAVGATVVLFDGSPFQATPARLWDLVDREELTHLGTSAKYLAEAEKRGLRPGKTHDLSSLRTVLSTGSPLMPASFDWVYGEVKSDLHLASIAGGTDLISCFVLGDPTGPVYRGEIQTAGLGMAVEVWGTDGQQLPTGELGGVDLQQSVPLDAGGILGRPRRSQVSGHLFREHSTPCVAPRRLDRTNDAGRVRHPRPLGCHLESGGSADWDRRNLPAG